jgi:site-specific DNA-cytosine methylase
LDEHAIKVTQANYPDTIQLGDVTKWREWDIDWASIDLLIGGSPCQGFSFAGKQLAFDDPRSALFFVYVDVLNHIRSLNPDVKFLLENVKMKKEYMAVISEHLGVEPCPINSALLSAQNRQRYYWANWEFGQPEDKGILLADIIEDGGVDRNKAHCIDANYFKGGNLKSYFTKDRRKLVFTEKSLALLSTMHKENAKSMVKRNKKGWLVLDEDLITYRKLTPLECERLQTIDGGYTAHVSNTQRYRMIGNGWTVDVIAHIFKSIYTPIPT